MHCVKVDKSRLIEIIRVNREKHQAQYRQAQEGFVTLCVQTLEREAQAYREGKREPLSISERPPEDHTREYDRAAKMLEMSVEETITLSAQDFDQFVMDDWQWKHQWLIGNSKYLSQQPG